MKTPYFKEVFDYPLTEFRNFLNEDDNDRIVFSGKFGIGKSRFLRDFFDDNFQKELYGESRYNVFHLNPVNYAISSNEDIIKYIKYDLIIELLKKQIDLEEFKSTYFETLPFYLSSNFKSIFTSIIETSSIVGKDVSETVKLLEQLWKGFVEYHARINTSNGDKLIEWSEDLQLNPGLFENDVITKILADTISKLGKESILIVDDLDRLDPDHVFRILNVFAAHLDTQLLNGRNNKFGFTKIIFVCDINNIKTIFHQRHGAGADFFGYIDKFYSKSVYVFDNKPGIEAIINTVLKSITSPEEQEKEFEIKRTFRKRDTISSLLTLFIFRGHINLRAVLRMYETKINFWNKKIKIPNTDSEIQLARFPILFHLYFINEVLGKSMSLESVFEMLKTTNDDFEYKSEIFSELIAFLFFQEFSSNKFNSKEFRYADLRLYMKFESSTEYFHKTPIVHNFISIDVNDYSSSNNIFIPDNKLFWSAMIDSAIQLRRCRVIL